MQFTVTGQDGVGTVAQAYTGGRPLTADRPLLVFVHGAQHDHSVWIMQTRYLAHHGFNVLAVDLPGHGRSAGVPLATIEALADWVCAAVPAACQAAGLSAPPPTVVIGHSMGSLVALELGGRKSDNPDGSSDAGQTAGADSRPAWLIAVALLATAVPMRVSDALLAAARDDESAAFDMINRWSSRGINHLPGTPGPGFSIYNQNRRLMERQKPGVLANDFAACNAWDAGLERASALTIPTLFVLAEHDQMTPPRAARAAIERVANAEVATISRSGHNLMAERPDATLAALHGWLQQLPARRQANAP
jgi:pimeloyl-ACP methyl ester carboxylesterase